MDIYDHFKRIVDVGVFPRFIQVLEIGSCDGADTVKMNDILDDLGGEFEQAAFEPVAANFEILRKKVMGRDISLYSNAIGAKHGTIDFWHSTNPKYYGSSSIRAPKESLKLWPDMTFEKTTVQCETLDSFQFKPVVDFIWADVQGAEIDLIEGGKETLARTRFLYTEFSDKELYHGEILLEEILRRLPDFEIVELYDHDVLLRNVML